jgi:hypothetical protein
MLRPPHDLRRVIDALIFLSMLAAVTYFAGVGARYLLQGNL